MYVIVFICCLQIGQQQKENLFLYINLLNYCINIWWSHIKPLYRISFLFFCLIWFARTKWFLFYVATGFVAHKLRWRWCCISFGLYKLLVNCDRWPDYVFVQFLQIFHKRWWNIFIHIIVGCFVCIDSIRFVLVVVNDDSRGFNFMFSIFDSVVHSPIIRIGEIKT